MSDLGALVLERLAHGRWTTIDNLSHSLAVPRRSIEDTIQSLRLAGHPVVGGDDGVKLSNDPREVRAYAEDRRRRLVSIAKGTRALMNTARRMDGPQTRLWTDAA